MKLLPYILIFSWLFGMLDWKVVHLTRWQNRAYLDWMHAHEQLYALVTEAVELVVCTPCFALKQISYEIAKQVEASPEEQAAITHAPGMSWQGFYRLAERGKSWTFIPWTSWLTYWFAPTLIWWRVAWKKI